VQKLFERPSLTSHRRMLGRLARLVGATAEPPKARDHGASLSGDVSGGRGGRGFGGRVRFRRGPRLRCGATGLLAPLLHELRAKSTFRFILIVRPAA